MNSSQIENVNLENGAARGQCEASCSIAWVSVKDKLPEVAQLVLAYMPSRQPTTSFHTISWWFGDEQEYTHWAELTPPIMGGLPAVVGDLTLLVRRLAHQLEKANKDTDLPRKAMDYLRRKNLVHVQLRGDGNKQ